MLLFLTTVYKRIYPSQLQFIWNWTVGNFDKIAFLIQNTIRLTKDP